MCMVIRRSEEFCNRSIRDITVESPMRKYNWLVRHLQNVLTPCNRCGDLVTGLLRHVHHIDHNRENDDFSNFELLCRVCHKKHHTKINQCTYCKTLVGRRLKYCSFCNKNKSKVGKYCKVCSIGFDSFTSSNSLYCSKTCATVSRNKATKGKFNHADALIDFKTGMCKSDIARKYKVSPSAITKLTRGL